MGLIRCVGSNVIKSVERLITPYQYGIDTIRESQSQFSAVFITPYQYGIDTCGGVSHVVHAYSLLHLTNMGLIPNALSPISCRFSGKITPYQYGIDTFVPEIVFYSLNTLHLTNMGLIQSIIVKPLVVKDKITPYHYGIDTLQ